MKVLVTEDIASEAGAIMLAAIEHTLQSAPVCRIAVAGGSTPEPVLRWLAASLSAEQVERLRFTVTDERHLALSSAPGWARWPAGTNLSLLASALLEPCGVAPEHVVSLCNSEDPDQDALSAQVRLEQWGSALDVVLLGVGPDGHIASLFPAHPALDATGLTTVVRQSPKPPSTRVSLTFELLRSATTTVLLATGAAKAPALARAHHGDRSLPLAQLGTSGDTTWVLDAPAASMLEL